MIQARRPVRLLVFGASLRDRSLNTQLATLAGTSVERHRGEVIRARMEDFNAPLYHDDLAVHGAPEGVQRFRELLFESDGMVVSSPEYNGSMPGILKNLIDWTSQYFPHPFDAKSALLLSASQSRLGGSGGLWALRVPLEHLGMRVYPEMFSLTHADNAFDGNGLLRDAELQRRFDRLMDSFMTLVEATKVYHPGLNFNSQFVQPMTSQSET